MFLELAVAVGVGGAELETFARQLQLLTAPRSRCGWTGIRRWRRTPGCSPAGIGVVGEPVEHLHGGAVLVACPRR